LIVANMSINRQETEPVGFEFGIYVVEKGIVIGVTVALGYRP